MRPAWRRTMLALVCALEGSSPTFAQQLPKPSSQALTGREQVLAAVIAAMMICGLISFFASGRVSVRTHVALALLGVLAGGFGLLVLFGSFLYEEPVAAVLILLLLIALFRLMSQFEGSRRSDRKESKP